MRSASEKQQTTHIHNNLKDNIYFKNLLLSRFQNLAIAPLHLKKNKYSSQYGVPIFTCTLLLAGMSSFFLW